MYMKQREDTYTHISGEHIFEGAQKIELFFPAVEIIVISRRKIVSLREIANSFIYEKFRSVSSSKFSPNRILLIEIDQRYFYVLLLDSIISRNLISIEIMLLSIADIFSSPIFLTMTKKEGEEGGIGSGECRGEQTKQPFSCIRYFFI